MDEGEKKLEIMKEAHDIAEVAKTALKEKFDSMEAVSLAAIKIAAGNIAATMAFAIYGQTMTDAREDIIKSMKEYFETFKKLANAKGYDGKWKA